MYLEKLWCATLMTKSAQKFRSLVFKNLYWNQCDYLQSSPHSTVNTWPIGAPITCSNFGPFIGVAFVSSSDPLWKVSDLFDLKKAQWLSSLSSGQQEDERHSLNDQWRSRGCNCSSPSFCFFIVSQSMVYTETPNITSQKMLSPPNSWTDSYRNWLITSLRFPICFPAKHFCFCGLSGTFIRLICVCK